MSHEIRTPLNAILGFSEVVKNEVLSIEIQKEYLNHISSSGTILLKLIGDILDISKIDEGKLELIKESYYFKESIKSAILPYKYKSNEKGLTFELEVDNEIPDLLIGDAHRLNQTIINLIGNAIKFTKKGGINVNIHKVKEQDKTVSIQFTVTDTGIGIPKEKHQTIFNTFSQADNTIVREFGGSGLGLSIVKELVSLMGSTVNIVSPVMTDSEEGGSAFSFTIDLEIDPEKRTVAGNNKFVITQVLPISVLVVEDNLVNQRLAKAVLKKMVLNIDFAGNSVEAIEKFKTNNYSIVFMDVQMPVMDGYEATRFIRRELKSEVPILGLTANVFKEDIENCFKSGMDGYLGKPYTERQMYDIIHNWVVKKK